jgi:hypothetical protein
MTLSTRRSIIGRVVVVVIILLLLALLVATDGHEEGR